MVPADVSTIACNGSVIYYNQDWAADAELLDIQVGLAHVVTACALEHHLRRDERDYETWQEASRDITTDILRESGLVNRGYYGRAGRDDTVETVYDRIYEGKQKEEEENENQQQQGSGDGNSEGGGGENGGPAPPGEGQGDQQENNESTDKSEDSKEENNQKPGGPGRDTGPQDSRKGSFGEVMDAPPGTDKHEEALGQSLAGRSAMRLSETCGGSIPSVMKEHILSTDTPDIPWQELLRQYMTVIAQEDFSWSHPNRRYVAMGIHLPGRRSERVGSLAIVLDTSGSISQHHLGIFWAGVREMVEELVPSKLFVYCCDTSVQSVKEYTPDDLPETLEATGGGGTDFRDAFRHIMAETEPLLAVLYWTDLCVPLAYIGQDPGIPVLWLKAGRRDPAVWRGYQHTRHERRIQMNKEAIQRGIDEIRVSETFDMEE